MEGVGTTTSKAAHPPAERRGLCGQCRHVRSGTSITNVTFNAMLPTVQTAVQQHHVAALNAEAQLASDAANQAKANADLGLDIYNMRPTASSDIYCGLDEFADTYHITAVKNLDKHCSDFAPKEAASRSCGSCAHLVRPSDRAFSEIQRCVTQLAKGDELLQQIKTTLESRAPLEYESCVNGRGVLTLQPGFLPWCRAWSDGEGSEFEAARFVVGPVVNVGNDCDRWQLATRIASPEDAELQRLVAQFQDQHRRAAGSSGVVTQLDNETFRPLFSPAGVPLLINPADPQELNRRVNVSMWGSALEWAARWAAIELVTFCLKLLGAEPSFITSIGDSIRTNNPPLMGDMSDDGWMAWLRQQDGSGHPGTRYLPGIAPYQQGLHSSFSLTLARLREAASHLAPSATPHDETKPADDGTAKHTARKPTVKRSPAKRPAAKKTVAKRTTAKRTTTQRPATNTESKKARPPRLKNDKEAMKWAVETAESAKWDDSARKQLKQAIQTVKRDPADPMATYLLGWYANEDQNAAVAKIWFRQAIREGLRQAAQGDPPANSQYVLMAADELEWLESSEHPYEEGSLRQAAEQGNAFAAVRLGQLLTKRGEHPAEVLKWCKLAEENTQPDTNTAITARVFAGLAQMKLDAMASWGMSWEEFKQKQQEAKRRVET